MDGLHQRGKIWHFCWKTPQGRRREISTHSKDFDEARGIRARLRAELQLMDFPSQDERFLFSEAARQWIEHANLCARPNTARFRRSKVKILCEFFGPMRLREITPTRIQCYEKQRIGVVAAATVNAERWILRLILARFGAWTEAHRRICRSLPVQTESKGRALSGEECRHLLACAEKNSRWRRELLPVVILGLHTGLRSAEIRGLRLGDIFVDAQPGPRLAIRRATTKSAAGERLVLLDEPAVRAIEKLQIIAHARGARRSQHFLFPLALGHGTTRFGQGWDPCRGRSSWGGAWGSLRRAAGLRELRFHDLRHTYITMAAEVGVPIDMIMSQVGHLNPKQTKDYVHISQPAVLAAVQLIQKGFEQTS